MKDAMLDKFRIAPVIEQSSYCLSRNVLYKGH